MFPAYHVTTLVINRNNLFNSFSFAFLSHHNNVVSEEPASVPQQKTLWHVHTCAYEHCTSLNSSHSLLTQKLIQLYNFCLLSIFTSEKYYFEILWNYKLQFNILSFLSRNFSLIQLFSVNNKNRQVNSTFRYLSEDYIFSQSTSFFELILNQISAYNILSKNILSIETYSYFMNWNLFSVSPDKKN